MKTLCKLASHPIKNLYMVSVIKSKIMIIIKRYLYCYNSKTSKLESFMPVLEENDEIIGMLHHPFRNIILVFTLNGSLIFLKP